jgi:glycosyltransferase involved in cell wall biosynthesis
LPISVVIPSHNGSKFIGRCLESIFRCGLNVEIILVEDGVVDDTERVLRAYPVVRHVRNNEAKGAPCARNIGMSMANGSEIMFLDVDDYIEDHSLKFLSVALQSQNADIAVGPWMKLGGHGNSTEVVVPKRKANVSWVANWLKDDYVPTCAVLWSARYINRVGGWDEATQKNQDGELMIRAISRGAKLAYAEGGVGVYWQHESISRISAKQVAPGLSGEESIYREVGNLVAKNNVGSLAEALAEYCLTISRKYYESGDIRSGAIWHKRSMTVCDCKSSLGSFELRSLLEQLIGMHWTSRLVILKRGALSWRRAYW